MGHVSTLDTVLAVLLTLWAVGMWVAVFGLGFLNRGPARSWLYPAITTVILFGVVGQIAHLWEHIAQVIFWVKHPSAPSGMSPWGMALSMGYGQMNKAMPTLGMETLHLVGNFIFLAGLAAAMVLTRRFRGTTARKWATMGVWMQGIHGLEHLSLTLSIAFGAKRAIGLSTWFGMIPPGPALTTYRVWWHFVANVIGSIIFAVVLYQLWKYRQRIKSAYQPGTPRPSGSTAAVPEGRSADGSEESAPVPAGSGATST